MFGVPTHRAFVSRPAPSGSRATNIASILSEWFIIPTCGRPTLNTTEAGLIPTPFYYWEAISTALTNSWALLFGIAILVGTSTTVLRAVSPILMPIKGFITDRASIFYLWVLSLIITLPLTLIGAVIGSCYSVRNNREWLTAALTILGDIVVDAWQVSLVGSLTGCATNSCLVPIASPRWFPRERFTTYKTLQGDVHGYDSTIHLAGCQHA